MLRRQIGSGSTVAKAQVCIRQSAVLLSSTGPLAHTEGEGSASASQAANTAQQGGSREPAQQRRTAYDERSLKFLVCPLSKEPLRCDSATNELVSDSIGVAYPIVNGVPWLVPKEGRVLPIKEGAQS
ncbi:hypothetical protein WJX72_009616 [[Myrmecia] bisecta]|uniref:Protein preY, mitochondrial n=1 Tax=[Myrmecia] bisecta TaxID=41462 RepID=A0AAW1R8X0_9CHLO